jgi:putative acetyltransferase
MMRVFLIGGVGGTGKTLLASKLMRVLHIPYVSIDHLMMGMVRSDPDCHFSPLDSGETIGRHMWPFLKAVIQTNIENNHSIILEGFQLQPEWVTDFTEEYQKHIIPVFIGFSEQYLRSNLVSNIRKHRHVVERRENEALNIESLITQHLRLKSECVKHQVTHFEIDESYESSMERVLDSLAEMGGA